MHHLDTLREMHPGDADWTAVIALVDTVTEHDGRRPLSDHLWLDLTHGGRPGFAGLLLRNGETAELVAYAQVSGGNEISTIEVVVHPNHRDDLRTTTQELLDGALRVVAADGGAPVTWWVTEPAPVHESVAAAAGLVPGRRLLQMRRSLPTGAPIHIETRAFQPGVDDETWLEVNNRAFAAHAEQGGWDLQTLRQRQQEDWFDPAGFLLHERDGRLAGFCWTKLHTELDPVVGEIYVIAVDPDFHGHGLGSQLTIAGLDAIASQGVGSGMLYVDADNTSAVRMYQRLGFTTHRTDVAFVGDTSPGGKPHDQR